MADEKVNVPEGVTTAVTDDGYRKEHHEEPRAQFLERQEGAKDVYSTFGVKNHQQLVELVKSNPIVAAQVADALVAKTEVTAASLAAAGIIPNPNAPQEDNVTGDVDRTGDVATKLHHDGENTAPPVIKKDGPVN